MWATKGSPYSIKEERVYGNSMKWHLLDEESVEKRPVEVGWVQNRRTVEKTFGWLMCGGKKSSWISPPTRYDPKERDGRYIIITRDKINVMQANVCTYCRNYVLKQAGKERNITL